ncbi:MAG: DUF305 domain-containing protein [Cyanobacteriota bacterium]
MASPVGTGWRIPHRTLLLAGIGSITGVLLLATGLVALQAQPIPPEDPQPLGLGIGPERGMGMGGPGMGLGDQRFMQMMVPHHQVAVAMAELAQRRSRRPEILGLAGRIKASQSQEIAQMRLWLQQWYPATAAPSFTPPMGLESLRNAADFDRVFLEQMVAHHRMGVRMAAMAQIHTRRLALLELEQQMVRSQSQEIEQMLQWYSLWYGVPTR